MKHLKFTPEIQIFFLISLTILTELDDYIMLLGTTVKSSKIFE